MKRSISGGHPTPVEKDGVLLQEEASGASPEAAAADKQQEEGNRNKEQCAKAAQK